MIDLFKKFRRPKTENTALQKITLYFYQRPRKTALLALVVVLFGIASYTTFLQREGFPSIDTPIAVGQGTYLVNDPAKVDSDVAKPLSKYLLKQDGVKSVSTSSGANFLTAVINYKTGIDAEKRSKQIQEKVVDESIVPETAEIKIDSLKFGYTERGDTLVISLYQKDNKASTEELVAKAQKATDFLQDQDLTLVEKMSIINPYEKAKNPFTGQIETTQKSFDRYGVRSDGNTQFYDSVVIGLTAKEGADKLKLYTEVENALKTLSEKKEFDGYKTTISASDKPAIDQQINELQTSLFEGLIAVLVVCALVIAIRASFITVLSMITVIAATNALLFVTGYSLNTMTLFALILGLSLIVDDTIIMVEALEAQRRRFKTGDEIVVSATGKVAQAMIAATSTASLSFAPLLFIGGILGTFIRTIPITIISALVISLVVALVFIPLFARFLLLSKDQIKKSQKKASASSALEHKIAEFIATPMLKARNSKKKLAGVGLVAVLIGFSFIGFGGYMFNKVQFNIFPPSKDTNQLRITTTNPDGTTIAEAEQKTDEVNRIIASELGNDLDHTAILGKANQQSTTLTVYLKDYKERNRTSPEMIDQLNERFKDFPGIKNIKATQVDAGPPASRFSVRVNTEQSRTKSLEIAKDIETYLKDKELKRKDGTKATFEEVSVSNAMVYNRADNKPYIAVEGSFKDSDTSTLVALAQTAVEEKFDKEKLAEYGLKKDTLSFNFGQEDENKNSFQSMIVAFPLVLIAIYILLAIQFRSFLQPLVIFMAIPFSLFGITLGLYFSDNPFSFFAMMGFFALIGLSIKNTILLTDYANQARRRGAHPVDAAHEALAERFRPLVATSLTAIVSLIPLALSSPFWESLAIVLMSGLLSSTFLVITVFPYYYLGAEYMRYLFRRYISRPIKQKIVTTLSR